MWKQQAILERAVSHSSENKHPDCLWGLLSLPLRAKPRQSVKLTTLFHLLPRTPVVVEHCGRVQLKCDGTRRLTGGEVKGKLANGVGSQYPSHYLGTWCVQHYYR